MCQFPAAETQRKLSPCVLEPSLTPSAESPQRSRKPPEHPAPCPSPHDLRQGRRGAGAAADAPPRSAIPRAKRHIPHCAVLCDLAPLGTLHVSHGGQLPHVGRRCTHRTGRASATRGCPCGLANPRRFPYLPLPLAPRYASVSMRWVIWGLYTQVPSANALSSPVRPSPQQSKRAYAASRPPRHAPA